MLRAPREMSSHPSIPQGRLHTKNHQHVVNMRETLPRISLIAQIKLRENGLLSAFFLLCGLCEKYMATNRMNRIKRK